ncbi:FliH/SctL family protein [Dyella terrae]|uniref:FliH/SctL family protein n=1 Tax=Dyella terrae TaxID=522259 RepID=UPI001EFCEE02|nr:FliH/SctL family protein [Dyella terrae]ULU23712.1 Flagellar assembly protein FliH protein [Dyella terrae]
MIRRLSDAMGADSAMPYLPTQVASSAMPEVAPADTKAYSDGYREGFEAGDEDSRREAEARLAAIENELRGRFETAESLLHAERERLSVLLERLAESEAQRVMAMEAAAFEIALLCISKAFGERDGDQALIGRLVSGMVQEFRSDAVRLQVADSDRQLLPEQIDGMAIESDPAMSPGSCALVTQRGRIETSIAERLTTIHQAMVDSLQGAGP